MHKYNIIQIGELIHPLTNSWWTRGSEHSEATWEFQPKFTNPRCGMTGKIIDISPNCLCAIQASSETVSTVSKYFDFVLFVLFQILHGSILYCLCGCVNFTGYRGIGRRREFTNVAHKQ